jgi:hypothetical protein
MLGNKLIARREHILKQASEIQQGIVTEKIKAAVPPPPTLKSKTAASWSPYFQNIHDAAKTGDITKVEAIKTNPNPNADYYYAKVHAYKQQVLTAMKSAGTVQSEHVTKPQAPAAPKVDATQFPKPPVFKDAQYAATNSQTAEMMHKMAQKGDLGVLKAMSPGGSPKLQSYHQELVGILSKQLNPPQPSQPTKQLSDTLSNVVQKVKDAKASGGLEKIGYWTVLSDVGGVPQGVPTGKWNSSPAGMFEKGAKIVAKAGIENPIQSYTAGGFKSINASLRAGKTSNASNGVKIGKAIVEHGHELPAGVILGRKHTLTKSQMEALKPGQVVSEKGILSCSTKSHIWHGNVHWHLTPSPGAKGLAVDNVSSNHGEAEVLLAPNQKILVTKVQIPAGVSAYGNPAIIHGIILPTEPNQCC